MSDSWINRLVVSGPKADVDAFGSRVALAKGPSPTMLSFKQLQSHLPDDEQDGLDEAVEPWDDSSGQMAVGAPDRGAWPHGAENLTYRFSLAGYEPDPLLIRASKLFPNLCFVLGWVAPSNDEQTSRFIHNGHTLLYPLPARRTQKLRATAYRHYGLTAEAAAESTDDDSGDSLSAEIEGDWALLDAAVKHWNGKVSRTLKEPNNPVGGDPARRPQPEVRERPTPMTTAALPRRALGTVAQQAVIMFDYLVESAANCRVVTYGTTEVATRIPATFQGRVLDYLYEHALMPLRLPPLTALVVNSETRRPGSGGQWSGTWDTKRPVDADQIWRMAVALAITYPSWELVAPMVRDLLEEADKVVAPKPRSRAAR